MASFPAGVKFAKADFGCVGNGIADDTAALQAGISAVIATGGIGFLRLVLEPGVYLVSDTLFGKTSLGQFQTRLAIYGTTRDTSTIRLKNSAAGFNDPVNPKAVLFYASQNTGQPDWATQGTGNAAFHNYLGDLTIDTGTGNAGAIALDWICNNWGRIENVRLVGTSSGYTGLRCERNEQGPYLVKNVQIDGFDYGVRIGQSGPFFGLNCTFVGLVLNAQRVYGIYSQRQTTEIDGLLSNNSVPAISNVGGSNAGTVVLLNATLRGGSPSNKAIVNDGTIFLRDVQSDGGYAGVLNGFGSFVSEYSSPSVRSLFTGASGQSLRLPQRSTPEIPAFAPSDQASVVTYGADPTVIGVDDSAAIQAAMNSGKPYIYFPPVGTGLQQYDVAATITIPATVRVLEFLIQLIAPSSSFDDRVTPMFRIIGSTTDPLFIKGFVRSPTFALPKVLAFQHESSRPVVLLDSNLNSYLALSGAGDLYTENVLASLTIAGGQNAWGWQLDNEVTSAETDQVVSGNLRLVGLKTEQVSTKITAKAGSHVELLGGMTLATSSAAPGLTDYLFVLEEGASAFLVYNNYGQSNTNLYQIHVRETKRGVTKQVLKGDLPVANSVFSRADSFSGDSLGDGQISPHRPIVHRHHASRLRS